MCFSEAPLSVLTQSFAQPAPAGMRYAPFGVIVAKSWLFERGGRPVIYQAEAEYEALPEALRYRHVRYEPSLSIDFTWEREWRIHTPQLDLVPEQTTFVVPTRQWVRRFHQEHVDAVASSSALLEVPFDDPIPWHFIALEDLGVEGLGDYGL